ncbi:MAG TPA: response regulator [Vicinamibacterales bacterium]|nr:response regulator [Vicinamibacterales bacterium]
MSPPAAPTVVVLDDERVARDLLRRFLNKHGYRIVPTATAVEAIAALKHGPVDAVILDVRLAEELNGLDVLRMLRREAPLANVPVIILTGSILSEEEQVEVTRSRGFLFAKPESFDVLMKFLDQLLGRDQPQ